MAHVPSWRMLPNVAFLPLGPTHLPLLHAWLQQPHVREFWDDGDRTPEQVQRHYFRAGRTTLPFVIAANEQLAGYIQAYPVPPDSEYAAWRAPTGETWGIDLFIGEPAWLRRGLAVPLVLAFLQELRGLRPRLARVLIDPETRNVRARHVYARAGFAEVGRRGQQVMMSLDFA